LTTMCCELGIIYSENACLLLYSIVIQLDLWTAYAKCLLLMSLTAFLKRYVLIRKHTSSHKVMKSCYFYYKGGCDNWPLVVIHRGKSLDRDEHYLHLWTIQIFTIMLYFVYVYHMQSYTSVSVLP
jgi:hypothetical protein